MLRRVSLRFYSWRSVSTSGNSISASFNVTVAAPNVSVASDPGLADSDICLPPLEPCPLGLQVLSEAHRCTG